MHNAVRQLAEGEPAVVARMLASVGGLAPAAQIFVEEHAMPADALTGFSAAVYSNYCGSHDDTPGGNMPDAEAAGWSIALPDAITPHQKPHTTG